MPLQVEAKPFISCAGASEAIEIVAAADESALPTFSGTAYTGGPMRVAGYYHLVVVNLQTAKAASDVKALRDHEVGRIVGHMSQDEVVISPQRIKCSGVVSGTGADAKEVVANGKNKFPWQMSIGGAPETVTYIDRGEQKTINGRVCKGPCYELNGVTIREISFVALGADGNTSANVAASFNAGDKTMSWEQYLVAQELNEATFTALPSKLRDTLKAGFDAEVKAQENPIPVAKVMPKVEGKSADQMADEAIIAANLKFVANAERIDKIQELCKDHPKIMAQAIKEGWDTTKVELEVLRAKRGHVPPNGGGHGDSSQGALTPRMLEAAVAVAGGLPGYDKMYKDEELQAAHDAYKGRIGLQEVFIHAARQAGYFGTFKNDPKQCLKAAFSTASLPGILSNIANKFLLAGYGMVEDTWRAISAIRTVNDFKLVSSYRMSGNGNFEKVGPTGELKHGTLSEQTYTNQAETYGKIYAITRTMMINDDLDALSQIPKILGRGAALEFNLIFWTAFLDNAALFAATHTVAGDTGNSNLSTGAGSALSIAGLTAAELLFLNQVDPNGNPLGATPKIMLVPNALWTPGQQLAHDTEVRDTTVSTKYTTGNPHAGKWTPLRSSYLSNAAISGYSVAAHYLLADPNDVPVIESAFLNGNQTPIIENAEADFSTLGVQMRGYFDFGVSKQDFRGGVKSNGS